MESNLVRAAANIGQMFSLTEPLRRLNNIGPGTRGDGAGRTSRYDGDECRRLRAERGCGNPNRVDPALRATWEASPRP